MEKVKVTLELKDCERERHGDMGMDFYTFEVRNENGSYDCQYTVLNYDGEVGQALTGVPHLSEGGRQLLSAMCRELIESGEDILKIVEVSK